MRPWYGAILLLLSVPAWAGGSAPDCGALPAVAASAAVSAPEASPDEASTSKLPAAEILGLYLGMPLEDVEQRLREIGERVEQKGISGDEHSDLKQLWKLRDARFDNALVRFSAERRLKWISAYAREGGPSQLYSDVGDTTLARRAGRYIYSWSLEARQGRPAAMLTARGTSPERFSSVSLAAQPTPQTVNAALPPSSR